MRGRVVSAVGVTVGLVLGVAACSSASPSDSGPPLAVTSSSAIEPAAIQTTDPAADNYSYAPPPSFGLGSNVVSDTGSPAPDDPASTQPAAPVYTTQAPPPAPVYTTQAPQPAQTTAQAQHCYPVTSGGNCYSPGEYCRNSDHGASGIDGDGDPIKCEYVNGWRWERV
jgi:hypothetical protein